MIKYFIKSYGRYIAMALAFATISFLLNSCKVNAEEAYTITSRAFYNANGSALGQQTFPQYYVGYLWTKNTETTGISGTWYFYGTNNQSNITLPSGTTSILINANIYHGSADQISTNYTSSSYINYLRANFQVYVIQSDNTLSQCLFTGNVENNVSLKCAVDKAAYKGFRVNYSMDDLGVGSQIGIGLSQYYIYSKIDNSDLEAIIRAQADRIITSDETSRTQIIATINSLASNINGQTNAINNQTAQQHQDAQNQKESTDAINNSINNGDTSSVSLDTITGQTTDVGAISGLITIPLNLLASVITAFNGTCLAYNVGTLFNTNIVFPCINLQSILGSFLWDTIDIMITGIFIFYISKKFINLFNKLINLENIRLGVVDFV